MLIAVNTRMLLTEKMEGIGYFTYETMSRITKAHPEHTFLFLFDRPFSTEFIFTDNIIPVVVPPPARHPILWYLWHEEALPRVFRKYKPDAFIGTDGYLTLNTKVPSLAVFHDISFEHYPSDLPFFNRIYYRHYFPKFAKHAKRIAAVSEFTKADVIQKYKVEADKIDVVYNGVSDRFKPLDKIESESVRQKYTNGKPYFLFIGSIHQRKNISNLLAAFDSFKKSNVSNLHLVFAGNKRWWTSEMETVFQSMSWKADVVFTGRLSEEELIRITGAAFALTYISTFEGFGIPIIEGMKADIPVLTSNVTSMPEVAGDAALLCDPFSVDSIASGMQKLFADPELRNSLIAKGRLRRDFFTWTKTADGLWKSVEEMYKI